jgi:predicted acylesterase/phospholipase RssA
MKSYGFAFMLTLTCLLTLNSCCTKRECSYIADKVSPTQRQAISAKISQLKSMQKMEESDHYGNNIVQEIIKTIRSKDRKSAGVTKIPQKLKVIVLSGGGPKGAFGAGFLNGIKDAPSTSEQDLDYNIVTGISTGSIQATFVFLGPEYYDRLTKIYTVEDWNKFVPKKSFISLLFCGNSFRKTDEFKRKLKEYITDDIIDKVAERYDDGVLRKLYVGTVDLDSSLFVRWDMGMIARNKEYDHYRDVILAACSIPVIFPPVQLERQLHDIRVRELHVDGGIRHMAYLRQNMHDAFAAAKATGKIAAIDLLLNNSIIPNRVCAQNEVLDIATRAVTAMIKQSIENDLYRAYLIACFDKKPFRMTYMEGDMTDFEDDFYEGMLKDMKQLYEKAYAKGIESGWDTHLPEGSDWEIAKKLCDKP